MDAHQEKQIVEGAAIAEIFDRPKHPYTAALLEAIPVVGQRRSGILPFIPGSVALPGSYPTGCRFGPRCSHFVEQCAEPEQSDPAGTIVLRAVSDGHTSRCRRESELVLKGSD